MSLSLNLPYSISYPLTRLARRFAPPRPETCHDQSAYFDHQYDSTQRMHERFMAHDSKEVKRRLARSSQDVIDRALVSTLMQIMMPEPAEYRVAS